MDPETRRRIQESFPAFAWLLDVPEVGNLLGRAAREGWSVTQLQGQLYATGWWRRTSQTARNWDTLVATDPGEARRQRVMRIDEVSNEARRLGVRLRRWDIISVAEKSLRGGWDAGRVTQFIAAYARGKGLAPSGQIRATMQDLRALGKQYAVNITNKTLGNWAFAIATGRLTEDGVRAHMVNIAKTRIDPKGENKVLRAALDQGLTVRDAYASVIETVANELEVDPSRVDLTDNYWGQLLDHTDEAGTTRPMNQAEAVRWARGQDTWQGTTRSKETYADLGSRMLTKYGMRTP